MQKRVVEPQADEARTETDKVAVETRLTAEQFYKDGYEGPLPSDYQKLDSLAMIQFGCSLAEAFRDKSEAQSQQFAAQLESNIQFLNERVAEQKRYIDQCHTAHAGLREEIERLTESDKSVREFLERDYGISEITTLCSKYDDAIYELDEAKELLREARPRTPQKKWHEQVKALLSRGKKPTKRQAKLTELRAKLAEHERQVKCVAQAYCERLNEWRDKAQAAEAEAAALRERERWIPVEEKLPVFRIPVQVAGGVAELRIDGWWTYMESPKRRIEWKVTHWKALSAAPERGKGEQ